MKINLEKLASLETQYRDKFITTNTLQNMLNVILDAKGTDVLGNSTTPELNYVLSLTTLQELGIVEEFK